ncbi:GNAT family N-acetyltransferase [Halalkalibacter akibai]|nr:GNAT family N-acetyltransferase [Halalkalibacter akibai]
MTIIYQQNKECSEVDLKRLYDSVNWTAYTKDMPRLLKAINQSLTVITAWNDNELVGLIRVVGDGQTIIYIQDILVIDNYQRQGVGSELLKMVLLTYDDVRQKILLTNDAPDVRRFYEKHGFASCDKGELVSFAKFN